MPKTSLYLITPPIDDIGGFHQTLAAAMQAGGVDCVLLRFANADEAAVKQAVKALAAPVQQAGAALLIEPGADSRLAARAGADGVHARGIAAAGELAEALRPERIVGVSGLRSRDDCMAAGELGLDYLMFGEPHADGYVPPLERTLERCQWWAELFEIPCVGYAPTLSDVPALSATGVEFVALGNAVWEHPAGPAAALAAVRAALA